MQGDDEILLVDQHKFISYFRAGASTIVALHLQDHLNLTGISKLLNSSLTSTNMTEFRIWLRDVIQDLGTKTKTGVSDQYSQASKNSRPPFMREVIGVHDVK